ncbi:SRPBCC family protein [Caulobacter sp. DWR3-1-2]|uniref:SRPBCC family protein n=1 Tax=Caulobacter sp. DWR3-1-2 TaxID=2804647 RepID=UPI003CE97026
MQRAVEHRIGVQAPADLVWEVISDFATWGAWNPVHPRIEGEMRIGTTLTTAFVTESGTDILTPIVQDWVPYEQLHWRTKRLKGFVTAIRYIEIDKKGEENAIFSNGELFIGPLVRFVSRDERRRLRAAFTIMGEALRDHVEALWLERQKTPISAS